MNDDDIPEECAGLHKEAQEFKQQVRDAISEAREHIREAMKAQKKTGFWSTADEKYQQKVKFHVDKASKAVESAYKNFKNYKVFDKAFLACSVRFQRSN